MKKKEFGKQVRYLRQKKNIEPEKLCFGICAEITLNRLERGERLPNYFVLERILERTGKSMNKLEVLTDWEAYEIYYLREIIETDLDNGEYERAEEGIHYYEGLEAAGENLHRQYICKIKAILAAEYSRDIKESCKYLEEAIFCTLPGFQLGFIGDYTLGEEEITLILMWLEQKIRLRENDMTLYGEKIFDYIRRTFDDEESLANIYGKAAWIFMQEYVREGKWVEAAGIGIRAMEILTSNGMLLNLPQIMELLLKCYEKVDKEAYNVLKMERDSIKWVYETYGKEYLDKSGRLWKRCCLKGIYLLPEMMRQERKLVGKSQEKVAADIDIDQKTISRIENGRYKPKKETFRKLREYYEMEMDIYNTDLTVEDFELLEWERDVAREGFYRRYVEAERSYRKLKDKLDLKYNNNRQYCLYLDALFNEINGNIAKEELLQQCEKAFAVTRGNCRWEDLSYVVLNRIETSIMNVISKTYGQLGQKEKEIYILEQVLRGFENSKVDVRYHYSSVALVYSHLAGKYEESNQFDKAVDTYEKGIRLCLRCERGDMLGKYIMEKIYTENRKSGGKEDCKNSYKRAYQLLKLMKMESLKQKLEKYYYNTYKVNIN
ncbi:MAG: helix-turn-helix transcriptional regulator [Clostridiales bacterium]|nr:helix-turn-helix transcriptional regulator [Clostridiales bacterium]